MSLKLYEETDIQSIANSIRGKNGTTNTYKVSEMSSAIDAIETGSGSSEWQPPSEGLVYSDGETHVLSNSYLDTNQAILSTDSDFTIFVKFKGNSNNNLTNGKRYDFLHCINEASPWPGIGIDIYDGKYRLCALQKTVLTEIDGTDEEERKFFIDHTNGSNSINLTGDLGDLSLSGTWSNVNQTLIFGAQRSTSNVFKNYWSGEIYQILIYNRVLTNEEKANIYEGVPTIEITKDGKYNVSSYDIANVKVLDSLTETLKITSNDIYNVKNYANVNVVVPSTGEWTPEEDWWDIDSILENDTSGYQGSVICLLRDSLVSTRIEPMGAAKIITSDGGEYTSPSAVITHTWDTTKDKECSLGYKTRYVIWLYDTTTFPNNYNKYFPQETIYSVFNMRTNNGNFNSYQNLRLLEAIKFIDFTTNSGLIFMSNLNSLKKIWGLKVMGTVHASGGGIFTGCNSIEKTEDLGTTFKDSWTGSVRNCFSGMNNLKSFYFSKINLDPSLLTSYWTLFQNNYSMKYVDKIDFTSLNTSNVNEYSQMFQNCSSLVDIGLIGTIRMSGLNLTTCYNLSHETLLKFLNALYDYAAEGSTDTYTLILGAPNLAKLTDEEKAIATNKGWTLVERG